MIFSNLWSDLTPPKNNLTKIIKDYRAGLVPELPYFIVGQEGVKVKVREKLEALDSGYFDRLMLTSNYRYYVALAQSKNHFV